MRRRPRTSTTCSPLSDWRKRAHRRGSQAWNKLDLLAGEERDRLIEEAQRRDDVVPISALTGDGLDALRQRMAECLRSGEQVHEIRLSASDGGRIAWLHARGEVLEQSVDA